MGEPTENECNRFSVYKKKVKGGGKKFFLGGGREKGKLAS